MSHTKKHKPYDEGNRLPVAAGLVSRHNVYLAKAQAPEAADVALVLQEVAQQRPVQQMPPAGVQVLNRGTFSKDAWAAVERIAALSCPPGMNLGPCSLVLTRLGAVHSDETFEGDFFVSRVLTAGPRGYLFQAFHSEVVGKQHPSFLVDCTDRVLEAGDVLVFDPTTPHMAAPLAPEADTVLVLLQLEVHVPDEETLSRLVEHLPPCPVRDDIARSRRQAYLPEH